MIRQRTAAMNRSFRTSATLALALFLPTLMLAQIDRTKAPAPGPPPMVSVGESKNSMLPNGMHVIVVENHKLPMVSVQVRFDHPPVMQGPIAGYQDLVGELLTTGTARRTKEQVDETVDLLGAQLSGASDGLFASSLKKNFPELMRLVYEVVAAPAFPAAEFEKAKTRYISSLKSRMDDPDQIAETVGRSLTFTKHHPYGEVPTEATLAKVQRNNLMAFYERFFQPKQGYIVFVGDITEEEAVKLATDLFATWTGATVQSTTDANGVETVKDLGPLLPGDFHPEAKGPRQICFVDRPGSAQSVIRAGFPLDLKPNDPQALQAQVLNTLLGGGVFNARLMQNLREKNAFTYGAYSSIESDRWCGNFNAGCSVRNAVTDSAVGEMMHEIERMRDEPVTEEELTLAKNFMAGSFARSLEDPRTIARFALNTLLYGLPKYYYTTYLQRLDTVSVKSVQAAAQRFLKPDNATILVVGDKAEVANSLVPLSATHGVLYYDANGDPYKESFAMPPKDMNAKLVLEAYVKAIGGADALTKVKTLRKEYTASVQGMTVALLEQYAAPHKYAMSMSSGAMVMQKIVYDGTRGKKTGMDGEDNLVDLELADAQQSSYMFPELFYQELDYGPLLNGVVDLEGRQCYRIMTKKAAGGAFTEYFDVETGLKVRRTEMQAGEAGNMQVITDFKDYKAVDGIKFPQVIDQFAGVNLHFEATDIEVNKPISPAVFAVGD